MLRSANRAMRAKGRPPFCKIQDGETGFVRTSKGCQEGGTDGYIPIHLPGVGEQDTGKTSSELAGKSPNNDLVAKEVGEVLASQHSPEVEKSSAYSIGERWHAEKGNTRCCNSGTVIRVFNRVSELPWTGSSNVMFIVIETHVEK